MSNPTDRVEIITSVQRRRRWTASEKVRIVEETFEPGMTVSLVARRHGVAPNQLFTWRRLVVEGALTAAGSGEQVVPASDYRALQSQVRELQRLLGRRRWKPRNRRWCSDGFEIGCDNGERVRVAFALDCCDREAMSFLATTSGVSGEDVRDLTLDRKKLAGFSALGGGFLRFPIGDRRCNRTRASVGNAGGNARPSLTNATLAASRLLHRRSPTREPSRSTEKKWRIFGPRRGRSCSTIFRSGWRRWSDACSSCSSRPSPSCTR